MQSSLVQDIRFGSRALARRPGFALVAILTLALGIGANTAVFSVVNGILLRELPYREPDRLAAVWPGQFVSNAELLYLQDHARAFESIAAFSPGWGLALTGTGEPLQLNGARTSPNFFRTLGVRPLLGRDFAADESATGRNRVLVLSYALWSTRFGSDESAVGRTVTIDGEPHVVIGVMPRDFEAYETGVDAWLPLNIDPASPFHRGAVSMALGRLRPDVTFARATADLASLTPAMRSAFEYPDDYGRGREVIPLRQQLVGDLRVTLLVLLGAVGLIVLIAGANVGNLLLVRATGRRREMAVRTALGASRSRLVRQMLAESVLLAVAGGASGLIVGAAGVQALKALLPADTPRLASVSVDGAVLAACAAVALGIGILFGLAPAVLAARTDPQTALRASGAAVVGGRGTNRLRGALVVAEIALALMLVIGAGLMMRTLWQLGRVNPGFDPTHVLTMRLQPTTDPDAPPGSTTAYFAEVIDRLAEIPGVQAVGASQHLPLTGFNWRGDLEIEGRPIPPGATPPSVTWRSIEGEYFRAMDIPLLGGRAFGDGDRRDAPAVVIVNAAMARRWWPNESPIGRRINVDSGTQDEWATIVGVVGSVRFAGLHSEPGDEIYRPLAQQSMGAMSIVLRTTGDPLAVAAPARRVVHALDPDVPISDVRALQQLVVSSVARPRIVMTLLLAFAGVGLVLGAIGIYGVVAYSVGQRTREIGVRVALGAHHDAIVRMVVAEGLRLSLAGVALGIVGALATTRLMRSLVFEVSTTDPATYAVLASLLVCIAGLASWLPARRAAKVDPMVALRAE